MTELQLYRIFLEGGHLLSGSKELWLAYTNDHLVLYNTETKEGKRLEEIPRPLEQWSRK